MLELIFKRGERHYETGCSEIYIMGCCRFRLEFSGSAVHNVILSRWSNLSGWQTIIHLVQVHRGNLDEVAKELLDLAIRFNDED